MLAINYYYLHNSPVLRCIEFCEWHLTTMDWNFPNMLCGHTKLKIKPTDTTVYTHMIRIQTSTIAVTVWAHDEWE
jgi:hypothetical protein